MQFNSPFASDARRIIPFVKRFAFAVLVPLRLVLSYYVFGSLTSFSPLRHPHARPIQPVTSDIGPGRITLNKLDLWHI